MSEHEHQLVQVHWSGPLSVGEIINGKGGGDKGLYQIYGQHVVFGADSLLYIGKTDDQTFRARFQQHERWLKFESDITIRLGVIKEPGGLTRIAEVEALTIWWHSPPYNSKSIWRYDGDPLHVQNWGAKGRLDAEYTSHWEETKVAPSDDDEPE